MGGNRTRAGTAGALALLNQLQFFCFLGLFFLVPWQPTVLSLPDRPPASLFLSPAVSISLPPIDPFLRHFSLATLWSLCSVAPFTGVTADVREHTSGGFIVPRGRRQFTVDTHPMGEKKKKKTAAVSDSSRVPDPGWWN